ncbi:MAG TPA: cohesin domain-containing protein, partial [Terriglobales bacterium]|nr:cohesin domain-containing protein [Terriglobales bacterium]
MRLQLRTLLLLVLGLLVITAAAESARSLYNKGRAAEAREDYIGAFEAYAAAYQQKPTELKYRVAYQRMKLPASAAHVKKGQDLRDAGDLQGALAEFTAAVKADSSNFQAQQEYRRTFEMIEGPKDKPQAENPPPSMLQKRIDEAAGPVDLAPVSPQPITLEISNDSRVVYETIGKLAGVNVLFDPDYTSRRISLKLNGISLQEALDIIAFHSNTFWRPVTPNTIYVAANTAQKRKELEQNVLKTFYLANISTPTDLQEVVNTLRQILEIQKISQVNAQSAIIIRDTPDKVALAEKIIGDLDKARSEVIVDVAIMQVRRDKLHDIGIKPPTTATVTLNPTTTTGGTTTGTTATTTGTTTGTTATTTGTTTGSPSLTLNTFNNLHASDFAVSIDKATLNLLYTDNNTKLIQNPQIRASENQKASLKIGDRVPIATGSFGSGFGGAGLAGANGLVNTQFQYIDVGVNIDITPRVFNNREIGLKLSLDVSSVTGSSTIGGVTQPIISQRKIEHDIRLKEGEVNVLGGIFENQDTKSVEGLPGLAQLPFLKYLFSDQRTQRTENEIVFVLIPRIVRGQDLSDLNRRAIDVGTANTIDIRRVSPKTSTSVNPAPQSPVQIQQQPPATNPPVQAPNTATPQTQPQASTPQSGTQAQASAAPPANATSGAPAQLRFEPGMVQPNAGSTFNMQLVVNNVNDLYSAPMQINYDPNTLQVTSVSAGDFLSRDGQPVALVHREDPNAGLITFTATRPPG